MLDSKGFKENIKLNRGKQLIRGLHGEYYPCKKEIFDKKYETINELKTAFNPSRDAYCRVHFGKIHSACNKNSREAFGSAPEHTTDRSSTNTLKDSQRVHHGLRNACD